ncbi:MAG: hypothetical protein JO076_13455 [Verrucomicrobia bacterium]|nr:hypothetical protein [Verrucomicrobiota bacterium]
MKTGTTILDVFVHMRTTTLAATAAFALLSTPAHAFDNDHDGDDFNRSYPLGRSNQFPNRCAQCAWQGQD